VNIKIQTPNVDQIIGTGIDAFSALRPSGAPFVVSGHYGDIFAGWRAQLKLLNRRLVDETLQARLPTASKKGLQELASSDYNAIFSTDPQTAIGTVYLQRPTAGAGGVIKKGTRFRIDANPSANPAVQQAQYESVEPVYITASGAGSGDPGHTVPVRIRATRAGTHANVIKLISGVVLAPIVVADTLFDPTFATLPALGDAGGGSSGMSDDDIRQLSRALYTGQYAPTNGAIVAGALSSIGVKHAALVQDNVLARTVVFLADESWGYSNQLGATALQTIKSMWMGFGGRVAVLPVLNQLTSATIGVQLTDPRYAADVVDITSNIRAALRAYLDTRSDFYRFDTQVMSGVVAKSDFRILSCRSLSLIDMATGAALTQQPLYTGQSGYAPHYYLADNGVSVTATSPS
jgi:hypothetical protein